MFAVRVEYRSSDEWPIGWRPLGLVTSIGLSVGGSVGGTRPGAHQLFIWNPRSDQWRHLANGQQTATGQTISHIFPLKCAWPSLTAIFTFQHHRRYSFHLLCKWTTLNKILIFQVTGLWFKWDYALLLLCFFFYKKNSWKFMDRLLKWLQLRDHISRCRPDVTHAPLHFTTLGPVGGQTAAQTDRRFIPWGTIATNKNLNNFYFSNIKQNKV